jgi:hypothetical protein
MSGVIVVDRAKVTSYHHPDLVLHFPGNSMIAGDHVGSEALTAFNATLRKASEDTLRTVLIDVLANDDHTVSIFRVEAHPARGTFTWRGASVYRFEQDLLREVWVHPFEQDQVTLLVGPRPVEADRRSVQ